MKLNALEDLFVQELSELYGSEQQILKALPKMIKAASDSGVQQAFAEHKVETKAQVVRLEKIFQLLGEEPQKLNSYPIKGAIGKAQELIDSDSDQSVMDASLVAIAQKIEHFEIAGYGAARTHAAILGYEQAAVLLEVSLKEEEEMNAKLTGLAVGSVNAEASKAPYGRARTGTRTMAAVHSKDTGSAGHLLMALSIGAALAIFLGSADWRKSSSIIRP